MWGGVKRKKDFSGVFREWSSSKGVDCLRSVLFTEPRPWWVGWSLHAHRHWLDDRCGARLLRWCRAIFQLEHAPARKLEVYHNSQELFCLLQRGHRIGEDTFAEYLALCEVGGDLSSAFHWVKYFVQVKGAHELSHYVLLLRVAMACPSDGDVEDTVAAVREVWDEVFVPVVDTHQQPPNLTVLRRELFRLCHALSPRIADTDLLQWIQDGFNLTFSQQDAASREQESDEQLRALLHALRLKPEGALPLLELGCTPPGQTARRATLKTPKLVDSLLSRPFVARLEQDSFSHNVKGVVACIQSFLAECAAMAATPPNKPFNPNALGTSSQLSREPSGLSSNSSGTVTSPPPPAWNDYSQSAAHNSMFRQQCVTERPGVTAELYHYLIVAMSQASPRLALSTKEKLQQCGLRLLDLTRAVLVSACRGDEVVQVALIREQMREVVVRKNLDDDYECSAAVEAYWKYDYAQVLYHRNCLSLRLFYQLLVEDLGVVDAQRLIAKSHDPPIEDPGLLVVHDHDARYAIRDALRVVSRGPVLVQRALDAIATHCPRLDLALINDIPELHDYCLPDSEDIASSMVDLRRRFANVSRIFVLDASFIEAHENVAQVLLHASSNACLSSELSGLPVDTLGDSDSGGVRIVVTYTTLCQLADAAATNGNSSVQVVCFDKNLHERRGQECRDARQHLRQIKALLHSVSPQAESGGGCVLRAAVLHFSECILAQAIPSELEGVAVETNDDHQLLAVAALIRDALAGSENSSLHGTHARVALCTEDERLLREIRRRKDELATKALLAGIDIVCTDVPDGDSASGILADSADTHVCAAAATFVREVASTDGLLTSRIRRAPESRAAGGARADGSNKSTVETAESTWLAMLDDDDEAAATISGLQELPTSAIPITAIDPSPSRALAPAESETLSSLARTNDKDAEDEEHLRQAAAMFAEFDTKSPDERFAEQMAQQPPAELREDGPRRWRPVSTALSREERRNRGMSTTERRRVARSMSRFVGGRVPFHLRYRVVEANLRDQRNRPIAEKYRQAVGSKMSSRKATSR